MYAVGATPPSHGVDTANRDLDRKGVEGIVGDRVGWLKAEPHSFRLIHREHSTSVIEPMRRYPLGMVFYGIERIAAKTWKTWHLLSTFWDSNCALKLDDDSSVGMDF